MNEEGSRKLYFEQRQFVPEVTKDQIVFDSIFGIIGPILCLILDPFVFRNNPSAAFGGMLANYTVFAYLGMAIGIPTLILQLSLGKRPRIWGGIMAGILLSGALVAILIGAVIFRLVFFGVVFGINSRQILFVLYALLGLVPFFTSFVFIRNGIRAYRQTNLEVSKWILALSILLGVLISIGIPGVVQINYNQGLW